MIPRGPLPKFELAFRSPLVVGTEIMGNSCTSARSAKAPQDTMETPPSRCETKEEPTAWCPSSNRLNKKGKKKNYSVPETDAESHAMAPSTTTITLIDGWTTTHTEKLRAAVKDVVAANPILSGKVVAGESGKGLAIARTEHKNLDPATLNVLAGPSDFEPPIIPAPRPPATLTLFATKSFRLLTSFSARTKYPSGRWRNVISGS